MDKEMKNSVPSAKPHRKASAMPGQRVNQLAHGGTVSSGAVEADVEIIPAPVDINRLQKNCPAK